jgi:tripartite-type tricarboxylate transporter receptor subunit TctC
MMRKKIRSRMGIKFIGAAFLASILLPWTGVASAQEYPTRPVRLIVPVSAGGAVDAMARALSSVAPDHLGQPLIVVIKPGASGALGTAYAARAKPDGYTLLAGASAWSTIKAIIDKAPFNRKSFIPIAQIVKHPPVLYAHPGTPWKTAKEFVDSVKAKRAKPILYGSGGRNGSTHLPMEMLMAAGGIKGIKHVPFRGGGPLVAALLGGHVKVGFLYPITTLSLAKAGKIRPLAVGAAERTSEFPNVPTLKELGYDVVLPIWNGILAPAKTPAPVVAKLRSAFDGMVKDKSFVRLFKRMRAKITYVGGKKFGVEWDNEWDIVKKIVKKLGL